MTKKLYLVLILCTLFSKLHSQSFIQSIEHGVYIDNRLTFPYTQVVVTFGDGLVFEAGMLDLPASVNIRFNQTIQNRSGNLSYLVNNLEEPVHYNGVFRDPEWYYYVGTSLEFGKYRIVPQIGVTSYSFLSGKVSQYYRVLNNNGAYVDIGYHYQFRDQRDFIFFGYSWGLKLDPIR